jgi:hypothetical protein
VIRLVFKSHPSRVDVYLCPLPSRLRLLARLSSVEGTGHCSRKRERRSPGRVRLFGSHRPNGTTAGDCPRLRSLILPDRAEGDTKGEVGVPVDGRVPVAVHRPAARGKEAPTAAPAHSVRVFCTLGRFHFRVASARQLFRVNIAAPFRDVPVHVAEAARRRMLELVKDE